MTDKIIIKRQEKEMLNQKKEPEKENLCQVEVTSNIKQFIVLFHQAIHLGPASIQQSLDEHS